MRGRALAAAVALGVAAPGAAGAADGAVLDGLDKIAAQVSRIEAPLGQPVRFGTLEITVRACYSPPADAPPDSVAYLEIDDLGASGGGTGERRRMFRGWMFASSPALSALDHPIYDVWVVSCAGSSPPITNSSKDP